MGKVGFIFLRAVVYPNAAMYNIFLVFTWDNFVVDEENGVYSLDSFPCALC